ncbi:MULTISPECIES: LbetaH domain-containing protein [Sphingobacterium]|uniref:Serine acetyltransferase n=1 Tax=Sphingobacterium populi TaxID=1812824 RepID=A0ABW5UE49_9SPHI|nr:DapH/DapD/GlmU-related protein [Sphingobacterium sp. CFCC 11742]
MINSKQDLDFYLKSDFSRFDRKPNLKDYILSNEIWYIYHYQRHLRYVEYYMNTNKSKLLFLYHFFKYKRLGFKLRFTIYPNTVGPGLRIYHAGDFIHVKKLCKIGRNCTLLPGVVIGNKNLEDDGSQVFIGDNVYFGLGARVFGKVKIGDDVVVGANSVVVKDIASNCVVSGIPAKVIKMK